MIKVVHVLPDLPPCGAEKVVMTYLRLLKKSPDFRVIAISLSKNQHRLYELDAEKEGLCISYLDQNIHDNGVIARFRQVIQLHRALKTERPDVIHIHLSILWMVCFASIRTNVKKIFHTLHSDPEKTSYGLHVYVDRLCYKMFNVRTLALNKEMKEKADHLFHLDNTLILRNGIDLDSYKEQPRAELREQFGIADECFVLGHVGRFNRVKNHSKIIEVFKVIKQKRPLSKLLLVGDGEDISKIKKQIADLRLTDDVIFTGVRSDIPAMMSIMDCFIFPSLYEGLGIVLLEAQAAGLRCVVSDTVPVETTVTEEIIRLPLAMSATDWAAAVLGENGYNPAKVMLPITIYDLNNVIETLKYYYQYE